MAAIKVAPGRFERVMVNGVNCLVCAECRRPMEKGHSTIYEVPIPEKGLPGPGDPEQALCHICYQAQFKRVYPRAVPPWIHGPEYHPIPGSTPVPWDNLDQPVLVLRSDNEVFDLAIKLVKRKNDTSMDQFAQMKMVYERLKGLSHEDLELMFTDTLGEVTITEAAWAESIVTRPTELPPEADDP